MNDTDKLKALREYIEDLRDQALSNHQMYVLNEGNLIKDPESLSSICLHKIVMCDSILDKMDRL